jgi:DNA repair protein RecO (recombination protein O)
MESIKTKAIVLKRTNYGEADRILNVLTPLGKMSVMAKGVRKEKSKLAGGIELFGISDVVVHRGKGDLGILTSVRLVEFYSEIMKDLEVMEVVGGILKQASRRADHVDVPELFDLVWQVFMETNDILKRKRNDELSLIWSWWGLNVVRVGGEEINLRVDTEGRKLTEDKNYVWDGAEKALRESVGGEIGADHIKLMRLMLSSPLKLTMKVQGAGKLTSGVSYVAKCVNNSV